MGAHLHRMFVGTYTKTASRGIYSATLDGATGALGEPELAAEAPNPTYLALSPDRALLYAVCAGPAWAIVLPGGSRLGQADAGPAAGPGHGADALPHRGRPGRAVSRWPRTTTWPRPPRSRSHADGTLGIPRVVSHEGKGPHPTRQQTAHVHSANLSPDGRFAIVCDLGLDRIYSYRIDPAAVALLPATPAFIASAPGAGPRHLAFGSDRQATRT